MTKQHNNNELTIMGVNMCLLISIHVHALHHWHDALQNLRCFRVPMKCYSAHVVANSLLVR